MPGIIIFILGTVIGSFVNVLISRFRKERKWWQGRSFCDRCRRRLSWWENIPIVSYLILKGRCRTCHSPISIEYPLVELSTGILFFITLQHATRNSQLNNISLYLLITVYLLLVTFLILVFLYDFHYQIIPDWTVLGLVGLAFVIHLGGVDSHTIRGVLSLVVTGLVTSAFFLLLHLITRGRGMGLGDVKYAFFMGFFLGWPRILVGLYTAFLTGAVVGVILILMNKKKFGQHIAFGPFLVFGTFIGWFWGDFLVSNICYILL